MQLKAFLLLGEENRQLVQPLIFNFLLNVAGFGLFLPAVSLFFSNNPLALEWGNVSYWTSMALFLSIFGLGHFVGLFLIQHFETQWGNRALILATTLVSFLGYLMLLGGGVSVQPIVLFLGRFLTGVGASNTKLCLRLALDQHPEKSHPHLIPFLMGIAAVSFLASPWVGSKLANPDWLGWCTPPAVFAVLTALNLFFLSLYLPFSKGNQKKASKLKEVLKELMTLLVLFRFTKFFWLSFLFLGGWIGLLISFGVWIGQKWQLDSASITDVYAYFTICWLLGTLSFYPELKGKISSKSLAKSGLGLVVIAVLALYLVPHPYWYWLIIPLISISASFVWAHISETADFGIFKEIEGRILEIFLWFYSVGLILFPLVTVGLMTIEVLYSLIFANILFLGSLLVAIKVYRK